MNIFFTIQIYQQIGSYNFIGFLCCFVVVYFNQPAIKVSLSEDGYSWKGEFVNPQLSSWMISKYVNGYQSDSDEENNLHSKTLWVDDAKTKKRIALSCL